MVGVKGTPTACDGTAGVALWCITERMVEGAAPGSLTMAGQWAGGRERGRQGAGGGAGQGSDGASSSGKGAGSAAAEVTPHPPQP